MPGLDVQAIREQFPILSREVYGRPLVYLDSGASAQKPLPVLETIDRAYRHEYANVHRGLHYLSNHATEAYESVRGKIARFLGAHDEEEIVYVRSTTEAINLVASSWLEPRIQEGDEIVLSVLEHHANIVPWHFLRERKGAVLKWVDIGDDGSLDPAAVERALGSRTRFVALTHMSNVLGTRVNIAAISEMTRSRGVPLLVDGSQAAVHFAVDVARLGCDFYCVTGHKLYGPTGSGALYGRREYLEEMRPFLGGGDMIREVTRDGISYAEPPLRFEAGTPNIVQIIGLGAAIDFVESIGMETIEEHERDLGAYAEAALRELDGVTVYGSCPDRGAIFSFNIDGAHPHDVSTVIDRQGVAVRAGHHCAQPLMDRLGTTATCRASFAMYNTRDEVDVLVESLRSARNLLA